MVSAVFHTSLDTQARPQAAPAVAPVKPRPIVVAAVVPPERAQPGFDWRGLAMKVLPPIVGIAVLIGIWAIATLNSTTFPTPGATFAEAVKVFADPFYRNGPNDQGIGWNILFSLQRVAVGFGLAALVGIPAGFAIGRFEVLNHMVSPLISLLRPVSPLAWLPIGLLVFKAANPAAIWTIFICSIWPMIINTAVGVQRVPSDYLNVARVLNLSEWKVVTKILFPAVLPYMLTGVRLSVGTAWLVIVAAEMLTGGVGIGFWVWDEWNNLNVKHILIAILVIGVVGLLLEWALISIAKRFSYDET
ncbi:MAG TPA: nitrate ABC transporter permease [Burkholderiaceae bacterium]|nr:nitrate ABC transporter permease [Burkholderiaceae bacterium]